MRSKIVAITNIVLEPYWHLHIKSLFDSSLIDVLSKVVYYEEAFKSSIDFEDADLIVVFLNFESLYPDVAINVISQRITYNDVLKDCINKCKRLYSFIKKCTVAKIIWIGFEDYFFRNDIICGTTPPFDGIVDNINSTLFGMIDNNAFVDLKHLLAKIGISTAYNIKGRHRWNAPYSKELFFCIAKEIYKQYFIHFGITKKCLVLDCDNVLWGGVLSEDGIDGIHISSSGFGRSFHDFQCFLLYMYYHGVILAISSKNDEVDVLKVFREHSGMLLKEKHISCFCCNWDNKPSNINAISESLNIDLSSIVFVDDSPFELEAVKAMLPEVTTVLYNRDTVFNELSCFSLHSNTNMQTIEERTNTYKTNTKREELRKKAISVEEYISSLEKKVDIHITVNHELARVSELTQRTNKCTNGVRYTLNELNEKSIMDDYTLYTVCLSDKFSELGIVGVMGKCGQSLDLFSLSCRALGRDVEKDMLQYLLKEGVKTVSFYNTTKNDSLKYLFDVYGFKVEPIG